MFNINIDFCWWLEAIALPTEPQPLPRSYFFLWIMLICSLLYFTDFAKCSLFFRSEFTMIKQCDLMAKWFVKYLAIYSNINLPNWKKLQKWIQNIV